MSTAKALFSSLLMISWISASSANEYQANLNKCLKAAERHEYRGQFGAAIERYRAIEKGNEDSVSWRIARSYIDYSDSLDDNTQRKALLQQAIRTADEALKTRPDTPLLLCAKAIAMGKLALLSSKPDQVRIARQVYKLANRALEQQPQIIYAHIVLGAYHREVAGLTALEKAGATLIAGGLPEAAIQQSLKHLQTALDIDADNLHARYEYALTMNALGKPQQARQQLVALINEKPPTAGGRILQQLASEKLTTIEQDMQTAAR